MPNPYAPKAGDKPKGNPYAPKGGTKPKGNPYAPGSVGGGGTPTTDKKVPKWAEDAVADSLPRAHKAPSLLHQVTGIAGQLPRGLLNLGVDAGKDVINTGKQLVDQVLPGDLGGSARPRAGEGRADFYRRTHPLAMGFVDSGGRTLGDIRHPTRLLAASRDGTIVAKLLEDAANAALAGRVVSGVAEKVAGATAGSTSRVASTVAKAAEAPTAAGAAVRRTALLPVKKAATAAYEAASTGEGRLAQTLKTFKLDPNSRLLRREAIDPAAQQVSEGIGEAVKRGQAVTKILPDLDEQRAMVLVGEGEASALAKLREHLPPEQFAAHLADTYGDSLPRRAVDLAADVVEGKAPELAARIDEGLTAGRELPGGRSDRAAAYVAAHPSRAPQVGFDPLPQVVEQRLKPLLGAQKRVEMVAAGARSKADSAAARLGEAETAAGSRTAAQGATAGLEKAAMRVQTARTALADAKKAGAGAEDQLMAKAQAAAERSARSALQKEVLDYRRQAAAHARTVAADMEAGLIPDRPAPVAKGAPMHDVAVQIQEGLGPQFASRRVFSSQGGVPLDVWLEMWNERRNVVPKITSGGDYTQVADDAIAYFRTTRELRSAANGVVSRGAEGRALTHLMQDPEADLYLRGTPQEAVSALAGERGPLAPNAGPDALAAAYGRIDSGDGLRSLDRRIARPDARKAVLAGAEGALGTSRQVTTDRLLAAGQRAGVPLGQAQMAARVTENVARSAEARRSSLAGSIEAARRDAAHSLEAAPARLRPVLKANREAASLLTQQENRLRGEGLHDAAKLAGKAADELSVTLAKLKADGVDFDHFTHLKLDAKPVAGPKAGSLPTTRKGREQRQRKGSTTYDRTVRAQTQAEIDTVKIGVARQTVERIRTMPFVKRFDSIEAATKEGYVAWDPSSPFSTTDKIGANTIFVPANLHESFRSYFVDPAWDKFLKHYYDPAIGAFKVVVLPLSPSWQVGNVFGNALLATVGGGVGPIDLAKQITRAVKEYRRSGPKGERSFEAAGLGPRRLYTSGPTHEEYSFLRPPDEMVLGGGKAARAVRTAGKPLSALVRKSYALNGFVDDLGRTAVFLSHVDKGASVEQALRTSLKAMGDFSRMSANERRIVRRIIPFYAWQRHLTQLAFHLPIEHPLRTAWTLHLADQYGQDDSMAELPEYLRSAIPLPGGKLLGTNGLNPFNQVGGTLFDPKQLPRSLSPAIKLALANAPISPARGIDSFTGLPYTRPPGTGGHDDFGHNVPTAPSLLKQVTDISPQKRLLEALQGRGRVARYSTGDPYATKDGPIVTEKTPIQGLLRFLGFPLASRAEAERMAARAAAAKAKDAKAAATYSGRRAAQR